MEDRIELLSSPDSVLWICSCVTPMPASQDFRPDSSLCSWSAYWGISPMNWATPTAAAMTSPKMIA